MLRRVRIRGYKSLRDVEVRFDHPLSVIMGANASGKSNLFDALALLNQAVITNSLSEAFKEHRGNPFEAFSFGKEGIEGLFNQRFAEFSIEVDIELSPSSIEWLKQNSTEGRLPQHLEHFIRYSMTAQIDTTQGSLSIKHEQFTPLHPDLSEKDGQNLSVERSDQTITISAKEPPASMNFNGSPDKLLLPVFLDILDAIDPSKISMDLLLSPLTVALEISHWRFYDLDPKVMREPIPLRNTKALYSNGFNLPAFFNTMKADHPKHFEGIRRALHLLIPGIEAFDIKRDMEGYLYLMVREQGIEYSSRVISDGTLRMLALLAATNPLEPTSLIGVEEPENGVDPHRLRFIADLLKTTTEQRGIQVLVNTHSPLLPRYFSEDNLIYCWRAGGETVFEPAKTSGLWRDPLTVEKRLSTSDEDEQATPLTTPS